MKKMLLEELEPVHRGMACFWNDAQKVAYEFKNDYLLEKIYKRPLIVEADIWEYDAPTGKKQKLHITDNGVELWEQTRRKEK